MLLYISELQSGWLKLAGVWSVPVVSFNILVLNKSWTGSAAKNNKIGEPLFFRNFSFLAVRPSRPQIRYNRVLTGGRIQQSTA